MGRCIYLRKGEVHTPPVVGIKAGDLPVGQIVKLMEGGVETEFIVVNQGIPENSSLYDVSCNGTWLLRKDVKESRIWNNSGATNVYSTSAINTYLNGDYFNSLGPIELSAIKQVKIPYVNGTGQTSVASGVNGLSVKIFLLGCYEVGWTTSTNSYIFADGAKLGYFESGEGTSAANKRIAHLIGEADTWWLRVPAKSATDTASTVSDTGAYMRQDIYYSNGVRPALIISSTSIFDRNTYVLLGGASDPPPPLNIYSTGQSALSNVTDFAKEEASFAGDGLKLFSKYGFAQSTIGFKLSSMFISDYKTLVVKVGYTDTKGTPTKAVIGWGNGNYYYNLRYYNPEQYSNYGTTDYAEISFIGADSISNPTEYRIDISTVTNNAANYTIAMAFTGSGDSATTYSCYALITDIHLE